MTRDKAIAAISAHADAIWARGVEAAFLFGSTVRGEADAKSDIDLFVDIEPVRKFSLIDLCGVQNFLQGELGVEIDLLTRNGLLADLRPQIEQEAVRIF